MSGRRPAPARGRWLRPARTAALDGRAGASTPKKAARDVPRAHGCPRWADGRLCRTDRRRRRPLHIAIHKEKLRHNGRSYPPFVEYLE